MKHRKRPSKTRAERIASLEWNINDAKEALVNAVAMGDWAGVHKYTLQIQKMEVQLRKASSTLSRHGLGSKQMAYLSKADTLQQYEASALQRQRGRTGVP